MHSSLSAVEETEKEGADDKGSSQHLMRLCHALGPLVYAGLPLRPHTIYPANRSRPTPDVHHSWPKLLSEDAISKYRTRVSFVGARIPQELFDYILSHVERDDDTAQFLKPLKRPPFAHNPAAQTNLRPYTLVCRHWANKCRRYIFGGAVLMITSPQDMDEFIQYSVHGCPSLIPLHKVIGGIHIQQTHHATRWFCHRAQSLKLANVPIRLLELCPREGLLPNDWDWPASSIPNYKTPHWSIPPTVATPPSLLSGCCAITVKDVHMASFSNVVQFVRHFSSVPMKPRRSDDGFRDIYGYLSGSVQYDQLTWGNHCIHDSPVYRKPVLCGRPYIPNCVHIEAKGCTDNVRLCLYTAVARPTFAMHWMQEEERQWIFSLMTSLEQFLDIDGQYRRILRSDFYNLDGNQWPRIVWQFNDAWPIGARTVEVAFCLNRILQDAPTPSIRVVGLEFNVPYGYPDSKESSVDVSALLAKLRGCPTTLVINFRFLGVKHDRVLRLYGWTPEKGYEDLQEKLKQHRPLNWNPHTVTHTIIFTCSLSTEDEWSRIDPITLTPTGQTWQRHEDIIPSLVNEA
ncbi:hypothetical protein BC629DRAFT_1179531 [Irpex lacteus]|nr:hypothetical protein BC629DRAFT_1179531 [Irpex lacteus]